MISWKCVFALGWECVCKGTMQTGLQLMAHFRQIFIGTLTFCWVSLVKHVCSLSWTHIPFFLHIILSSCLRNQRASVLEGCGCNKWNTCLTRRFYLLTWGRWAEGPISASCETCNQHCQTQFPAEHAGLTLQMVCKEMGQAGWLAAAVLEESTEHIKPEPSSPGVLHDWTGLTLRDASIHSGRERLPNTNNSTESLAHRAQCF